MQERPSAGHWVHVKEPQFVEIDPESLHYGVPHSNHILDLPRKTQEFMSCHADTRIPFTT